MAEQEEKKERYSKVDLIDRIPMIDYDEDEIIKILREEKEEIDSFRSEWYQRKLDYLRQWDDYLDYPSEIILEGQKNVHIPVTFEKLQAWHSRMYKSIFAVDPIFSMEPLGLANKDEVEATKIILRWYLKNEINYGQGLKPFVDELLWDLGTDGWAVAYKRWETIERQFIDLEKIDRDVVREEMMEALGEIKKKGRISKNYKEIERIVKVFSGIVVETVPHECSYFPDYIPTSGDLNRPQLVMVERINSSHDLIGHKESGFFDSDAVDLVLEGGKGGTEGVKQELKRERERMQGVRESYSREKDEFALFTAFLRKDLKDVGYPQEYIFTASLKSGKVLRATYLDRVCRDGNRPVYKFDLLKRPRSSYSRGFVELLYPLNQEIDEFHNFRRASGKIANMPWGFYRASSGLEKEPIKVQPGRFYPVDDPIGDVRPIQFPNVTAWAFQEEGLAQNYADRLTSMPQIMQGQVPGQVGPLRSTSGVMALMNEAMTPMDLQLDRIRIPMGKLFEGILSDLQFRLPESVNVMVLGERSELLYGPDGRVLSANIPKSLIMGKYKFYLAANDAQYNPERDRQNALAMMQLGLSQFPVQMGITSPENAYNLLKDIYDKNGARDTDRYLTKPQMATRPLNLWQEYLTCLNGMMPMIVLNDDHESKAKDLLGLSKTNEYAEAKTSGLASPIADLMIEQAISAHLQYKKIVDSLKQPQNQSGLEVPVTIGARGAGSVNAQGQPAQGGQGERERGINAGAAKPSGVGGGEGSGGEALQ